MGGRRVHYNTVPSIKNIIEMIQPKKKSREKYQLRPTSPLHHHLWLPFYCTFEQHSGNAENHVLLAWFSCKLTTQMDWGRTKWSPCRSYNSHHISVKLYTKLKQHQPGK